MLKIIIAAIVLAWLLRVAFRRGKVAAVNGEQWRRTVEASYSCPFCAGVEPEAQRLRAAASRVTGVTWAGRQYGNDENDNPCTDADRIVRSSFRRLTALEERNGGTP